MALIGLIAGEVLDALQADEGAVEAAHYQRPPTNRMIDDSEVSPNQTDEIDEWLRNPAETDFTTVDTPMFKSGIYDPVAEFERADR